MPPLIDFDDPTAVAEFVTVKFHELYGSADDRLLLPEKPLLYADANHLFPLLGNLVTAFPEAAPRAAVAQLLRLESTR